MRKVFILLLTIFFLQVVVFAQDSLLLDSSALSYDDLIGVPNFEIEIFADSLEHLNRVSTWNENIENKSFEFWILIGLSALMALLILISREQVKLSFKSIISSSFAIQQSRTEKQGNAYFYYLYLILFILSFAFLMSYAFTNIYFHERSFTTFVLLVCAYFALDFIFSIQTSLFSNSNRIIEVLLASSLNYAVVLCILVWPALFFVVFAKFNLAKLVSVVFFILIGLIYLVKEWRILQILANEKVEVYSFHFFAYLCSFKILPIVVLIKILLS